MSKNQKVNFISLEKPFFLKLGFDKLIKELENLDCETNDCNKSYISSVLTNLNDIDKLKEGFFKFTELARAHGCYQSDTGL